MTVRPLEPNYSLLFEKTPEEERYEKIEKCCRLGLSAIMAVGLIASYFMGAPWFVPLTFFALALLPLFPLGKVIDDQRKNIPFLDTVYIFSSVLT